MIYRTCIRVTDQGEGPIPWSDLRKGDRFRVMPIGPEDLYEDGLSIYTAMSDAALNGCSWAVMIDKDDPESVANEARYLERLKAEEEKS